MDFLSDADLTRYLADFFESRVSLSDFEGFENGRTLHAPKTLRHKIVAHPEAVRLEDLSKPTYVEIDKLASLARGFVGIVGFGYLSTVYESGDGTYLLSSTPGEQLDPSEDYFRQPTSLRGKPKRLKTPRERGLKSASEACIGKTKPAFRPCTGHELAHGGRGELPLTPLASKRLDREADRVCAPVVPRHTESHLARALRVRNLIC